MLDQVAALVQLKLALLKHALTGKAQKVSAAITVMVFAGAFLISLVIGIGLAVATMQFQDNAGLPILLVTDGFIAVYFFFWAMGLMNELQRSEIVDFRKMLYLPVSLRMIFVLNCFAAMFSPILFFFALPAIGLCVGLTISQGPRLLLGLVVAGVLFVAIAAWTYYARGALVILLENKRRRRLVLTLVPLCFVIVGQLPNLFAQLGRQREDRAEEAVVGDVVRDAEGWRAQEAERRAKMEAQLAWWNKVVPLGWFPYSLYALEQRSLAGAATPAVALGLLAAAGFGLGYRSTWRYYSGVSKRRRRTGQGEPSRPRATHRSTLISVRLPFLDDDTSAVAAMGFVNLVRHPNVRLGLVAPIFICAVFFVTFRDDANSMIGHFLHPLLPLFLIMFAMLSCIGFIMNVFGIDCEGFRAYLLLPTARYKLLLGKNLALLPIILFLAVLVLAAGWLITDLSIANAAILFSQCILIYVLLCVAGNQVSLYAPYRISWEKIRAPKNKGLLALIGCLPLLVFPFLCLPAVFCIAIDNILLYGYGYSGLSLGLLVSLLFLALSLLMYRASLKQAGEILQQRQHKILEALVKDGE